MGRYDEAKAIWDGLPANEQARLDLPPGLRQAMLTLGPHWRDLHQARRRLRWAGAAGSLEQETAAQQGARDALAAVGELSPVEGHEGLLDALDAILTPTAAIRVGRVVEFVRNMLAKPGLTRLAKEAVGKASVYDNFLYVTDGGHYDNLGLVEALRRKPDRLFVLDASNDIEDTFAALGRAIATARMDLDCELVMDPSQMRRLREARAPAAWCTGRYRFATGEEGEISLAKAILVDGAGWDVEAYAAENPDFPRTSTGRQLYSEFDVEAYRALGHYAVTKILA